MKLRVAACQILTHTDVQENTKRIIEWVQRAADDGIDAVSFPEACLCSYTCTPEFWAHIDRDTLRRSEEDVVKASEKFNIAVILGTAHWDQEQHYNSILVIDKGGIVRGRYSKIHLAEEWPKSGAKLPLYSVCGVPSCFIVCHDVRYPELVMLPSIAGAQLCWFCTNESGLTMEHKLSAYRAMPIARATENSIFLIMSNAPADPKNISGGNQSHGNSKIIHPNGNVLKEAGFFEDGLVAQTIDLTDATREMAMRSAHDETLLKNWVREGVKLVSCEAPQKQKS